MFRKFLIVSLCLCCFHLFHRHRRACACNFATAVVSQSVELNSCGNVVQAVSPFVVTPFVSQAVVVSTPSVVVNAGSRVSVHRGFFGHNTVVRVHH